MFLKPFKKLAARVLSGRVLNPIKHSCSFFKHYINVQALCMVICFYFIHTEFHISIQKLVANDSENKSFDQSKTRTIVLHSVNFGIKNIQYLKTPRDAFAVEEGVFFLRFRLVYNLPYFTQNCASIIGFTRFTEMLFQ